MAKNKIQVPDFNKIAKQALEGLPEEVAEKARAFFLASFIKEGFTDNSFIAWPKRRDDLSHKMLSQSLKLRESIKIEEATLNRIAISAGSGIPYAEIHNNGGTINVTVTKKMRKYFWFLFKKTGKEQYKWMALSKKEQMVIHIPKRQFIGDSFTLDNKIDKIFIKRIQEQQKNLKF
jgi:phage gpG-like protein